jgi:predicted DNA-binding transcriptional regulator AlpA
VPLADPRLPYQLQLTSPHEALAGCGRGQGERRPRWPIADVCEELGISRSTFYDWRAKRKAPPCFKLPNGDLRIRRPDFERWLSTLEEKAA